jgi:hypothetical protein
MGDLWRSECEDKYWRSYLERIFVVKAEESNVVG